MFTQVGDSLELIQATEFKKAIKTFTRYLMGKFLQSYKI